MKRQRYFFYLFFLFTVSSIFAQNTPNVDINAEIIEDNNGTIILQLEYIFPENFHQTLQPNFFNFKIISPETVKISAINYPEGTNEDGITNFYGSTIIYAKILDFKTDDDLSNLTVKASWQLCDENGMCLFPESKEISVTNKLPEKKSHNLLFFLLLAFIGGVLLNVMPCVLPVLSIKALSLVKQGGEDRKKILFSSFMYTAGVVASLLILAIVIVIIKASGEQIGWGFQFQNSVFVIVLLTIVYIFALSLFEVFTITGPSLKVNTKVNNKKGMASHFISGIFAVLLATPCTAPFLGAAAGFAFSQSAIIIILIFIMVGLGLSLPFILIGFFPAVISKLPKPGSWMNTFREAMAFLLVGTSIWLADVLYHQNSGISATKILVYILALSIASWLYGKLSKPGQSKAKKITGLLIGIIIIGSSAVLLFDTDKNNEVDTDVEKTLNDSKYSSWLEFSPETVKENIGGEQGVFVAFSAKWCMTCRTNEQTVLFSNKIEDLFEKNNIVLIHGDYTNRNSEIDNWMNNFGRAGVPFYLWYPPESEDAILLPEIINKKMLTELIQPEQKN
ncbi:MAG: thioredoxin family protein [Spirochaetales bacterium]|nr:thioredoxin family protein [Spirochaetales bacterium]